MAVFHVYPVNDLQEHLIEENDQCPCSPSLKVDEDTGDLIYVHNSWDGREVWEELLQDVSDQYNPN